MIYTKYRLFNVRKVTFKKVYMSVSKLDIKMDCLKYFSCYYKTQKLTLYLKSTI